MLRYALCLTLMSFLYAQNYRIMGTGLELDQLNDYQVIVNQFDDIATKIGLNQNYFDTKINLILNRNGTPPSSSLTANFLSIKIDVVQNRTPSNNNNQYFASISISFNRLMGYDANAKKYAKIGKVWYTNTTYIPMGINMENFKNDIMEEINKKINKFSSSLIAANSDL